MTPPQDDEAEMNELAQTLSARARIVFELACTYLINAFICYKNTNMKKRFRMAMLLSFK